MQHVSQVLANASAPTTPPAASESLIESRRRVARLWEIFAETFGTRWTSTNGLEDTGDTWAKLLIDLNCEQIAHGVKQLRNCGATWPPSAFEFYRLCKPAKREGAHLLTYGRYLPPPRADEQRQREEMRKARALLANAGV